MGPEKSKSIGGKKHLGGNSNLIGCIDLDECEIKAASNTTYKGRPPATGTGICDTTDAMKCSIGKNERDSDNEYSCFKNLPIALL
jgi:hypothetical protein